MFVTGTVVDGDATDDEGIVAYEETVEWSDPRLPPTLRVNGAWYVYGEVPEGLEELGPEALTDMGVMVTEMNVLLYGPEGSWRGTGRALEWSPDPDPDRHYSYYVLTGEGAYEGMHALLRGAPVTMPTARGTRSTRAGSSRPRCHRCPRHQSLSRDSGPPPDGDTVAAR